MVTDDQQDILLQKNTSNYFIIKLLGNLSPQHNMDLFFLLFFTIILSLFWIRLCITVFKKYQILDNPKKYWKKRKPIPYGVGVIFFLIFFIMSFFFIEIDNRLILIWLFWGLVTFVSFLDDRYNVSPNFRLAMQILIGGVIGLTSIKIWYISGIFWEIIELEYIYITFFEYQLFLVPIIFTIFWYVFIFNALNWTDGIKGNTSLVTLTCFIIIFLLWIRLYLTDDYAWGIKNAVFIIQLSLILVIILSVYLYFDLKEKVLMGDAGTMFLWFMLATLAIIAGGKVATVLAVFGIYAVDALYVVIRRIITWKNPLKGDFTHLHHRLLDIWFTEKQVLVLIVSLSFIFWFAALFLETLWKIVVFGIIVCFVLGLSYIWERIKKITFKK